VDAEVRVCIHRPPSLRGVGSSLTSKRRCSQPRIAVARAAPVPAGLPVELRAATAVEHGLIRPVEVDGAPEGAADRPLEVGAQRSRRGVDVITPRASVSPQVFLRFFRYVFPYDLMAKLRRVCGYAPIMTDAPKSQV
jgi:hypothetical protein